MLNGIFVLSPGSCPRGGTWGCPGVKDLSFSIIAMWHIKLTGSASTNFLNFEVLC